MREIGTLKIIWISKPSFKIYMCKHNKFEVGQAENREQLIKPLQLLTTNQSPLEATRNSAILQRNMQLEPKQQFKNNMKKYKLTSQENRKLNNKKTLKS